MAKGEGHAWWIAAVGLGVVVLIPVVFFVLAKVTQSQTRRERARGEDPEA